jgi:N-carbamoylputrescine amidase
MPNSTVTLGLVQMRCGTDPGQNMQKAIAGIRNAAARGAQIVCLQELFRSQYFCQTEDHAQFALAEPIPGPSTAELGAVAAELGVVVVASIF